MSLSVQIVNEKGRAVSPDSEGALPVVVHPHPPEKEGRPLLPFRQFFTDDGLAEGNNNMRVDGSVVPVDYFIGAGEVRDTYIRSVSIVIADAGATLNKFGNITALTNGVSLEWDTVDLGHLEIHEALQTNFDFVRLCSGNPAFGDAAGSFRATNVSGTSEAYIPVLDFVTTFGLPWGIRLRGGTSDRLHFRVNDDTTGVDEFDAIAYGTIW